MSASTIEKSVGQGGVNRKVDVITVEILLNRFIIAGRLGSRPALFTLGSMTPAFIQTIKAFQSEVCGFNYPDGKVDPGKKTLAVLNGPIDAPAPGGGSGGGGGGGAPASSKTEKLAKVVQHALRLKDEGCHFLLGAMGATPGNNDGHIGRPGGVALESVYADSDYPLVQTASSKLGGYCCGRWKRVGGRRFYPNGADRPALQAYAEKIEKLESAGHPHASLPAFRARLYPRRIGDWIMLGEGCIGHRHFDCVGFVNYCFAQVFSSSWRFSIEQYRTMGSFRSLSKSETLQTGDIVIKDDHDHIGMIARVQGSTVVVQARARFVGVVAEAYAPADWARRKRLK